MYKKYDFPDKFDIVVTCASGVEKVVKSELKRLDFGEVPAVNGALTFSGDKNAVAKCNVNLRTGDRVYIKIAEFPATTFDELFAGVLEVSWASFLPSDAKILVNGKSVKSKLFALSACQSIVKKAIIEKMGMQYRVNGFYEQGSTYQIEFWIFKDQVTLLLNTSGAGLHKRGYRDLVWIAPIKETLASSLLLLSDFYWQRPFHDPFCGSGTIPIEAARIALNIAGGIGRKFDFCQWENFGIDAYNLAFTEAKDNEKRDRKIEIFGTDIDPKAINLAKRHAIQAGVKDKIKFSVCDVKNFRPTLPCGTIVTNPPYGERVYDKEEAETCYRNLGKALKDSADWSLFLITPAKNFEKLYGKRADRERKLYNSNKECKYYYYYGKKGDKND
jgi:putative N6-adenine-specific DNA methylase